MFSAVCILNVTGHEALLQVMSALKRLAIVLMRVADNVRMLARVYVYICIHICI